MRFETLRKIIEKPLISLLVEEDAMWCEMEKGKEEEKCLENLGVAYDQRKGKCAQVIFNYAHYVQKVWCDL